MKMYDEWVARMIKDIRDVAPEALVAGGYVRDLICERPVKDVDVFVRALPNKKRLDVAKIIVDARQGTDQIRRIEDEYFEWEPLVTAASYFEGGAAIPVNLIELDAPSKELSPFAQLERFDFGICRAAFNGEQFILGSGFYEDMLQQRFTLLRCYNQSQFERSMSRYVRLRAKYDAWPLVIPEEYAPFKETVEVWDGMEFVEK